VVVQCVANKEVTMGLMVYALSIIMSEMGDEILGM